jgi:hypothetical protein
MRMTMTVRGRVDLAGAVDVVERSGHDLTLMAELNPSRSPSPFTPFEAARVSKATLQALGYDFRS